MPPPQSSRSSATAAALPRIAGATSAAASRPTRRTAPTPTGAMEWTPSRLIRWAETIGPATAAVVRQIPSDGRIPSRGSAPASASWASRRELSQRAFDPQAASIASRHRRAGPRSSTSTFAGPPNITPHRKERTMTPRGRFGNSVSCASMASPSPGGAVRAARVLYARRRGIGSACSSTASGPSAGRAGSPAPAARQAPRSPSLRRHSTSPGSGQEQAHLHRRSSRGRRRARSRRPRRSPDAEEAHDLDERDGLSHVETPWSRGSGRTARLRSDEVFGFARIGCSPSVGRFGFVGLCSIFSTVTDRSHLAGVRREARGTRSADGGRQAVQ